MSHTLNECAKYMTTEASGAAAIAIGRYGADFTGTYRETHKGGQIVGGSVKARLIMRDTTYRGHLTSSGWKAADEFTYTYDSGKTNEDGRSRSRFKSKDEEPETASALPTYVAPT